MTGLGENEQKPYISTVNAPLIPGLKFFQNMAPHSNDAPYCTLQSSKKLETFNDRFPRKCPKTQIFDT